MFCPFWYHLRVQNTLKPELVLLMSSFSFTLNYYYPDLVVPLGGFFFRALGRVIKSSFALLFIIQRTKEPLLMVEPTPVVQDFQGRCP